MSVPCALSKGGLPVGLQIVTRPLDEATMFAVAAAWEKNSPTRDARPPL
jgi:Asp-tRNA(Asn)/Glu-tRNA(Gln) amidotransferase A subunit family amidase